MPGSLGALISGQPHDRGSAILRQNGPLRQRALRIEIGQFVAQLFGRLRFRESILYFWRDCITRSRFTRSPQKARPSCRRGSAPAWSSSTARTHSGPRSRSCTCSQRARTELLGRRAAALGALIDEAEAAIGEAASTVPAIFLSEEDYAQQMRAAERDWVAAFAEKLRTGQLSWPRRRSDRVGR